MIRKSVAHKFLRTITCSKSTGIFYQHIHKIYINLQISIAILFYNSKKLDKSSSKLSSKKQKFYYKFGLKLSFIFRFDQ